jgi:hypothetical protein
MVGISALVAVILGLPLGLLLVMTAPNNILDSPKLHKVLSAVVNTGRSFGLYKTWTKLDITKSCLLPASSRTVERHSVHKK